MARIHNQTKREAERRFPFCVDIHVPEGGLGNRLNQMCEWCRSNIVAGDWETHGHSEKPPGEIARDFARFYFMTADDADLFRCRWLSGIDSGNTITTGGNNG